MSAAEALKIARAAGVRIGVDGDTLTLEAYAEPPAAVVELLAYYKPGVIKLLRPANDGWSAADWQAFFNECISVVEFNGGLSRTEAEARAFAHCVVEWLNRNTLRSSPDRCHYCGRSERSGDPLVPFGTEPTRHAWLHSRCWPAWHAARKTEAIAALATMGIAQPRTNQ